MGSINVIGHSREDIGEQLRTVRRPAIYDLVYHLATDEPQFSTKQVAQNRNVDPRTVLRWIERGWLAAQAIGPKDYRIKLSALREFDERTLVGGVVSLRAR